jgi:hypothetical protein
MAVTAAHSRTHQHSIAMACSVTLRNNQAHNTHIILSQRRCVRTRLRRRQLCTQRRNLSLHAFVLHGRLIHIHTLRIAPQHGHIEHLSQYLDEIGDALALGCQLQIGCAQFFANT